MSAPSVLDYLVDRFDIAIEGWYEQQRNQDTDAVNRNVMCVGLIMCEHMRSHFPLRRSKLNMIISL